MPDAEQPALPADVLVGVATAGFQIEGGFNGPGEPANNWIWWERSGRVEPSGIACDFWRRPDEALDRAASIGCNAFRLSVEWARVEPEPGQIDDGALARYAGILQGCAERAMVPMVSLHHFTHPWWLGEEFWLTPGSPDRFADHVARVAAALAPWCRHWVTVNEPNIVALMGWITGDYPPGRRLAVSDALAVLDNLLTAHVLAYRVLHRLQPDPLVTVNTSASSIYEHDRLLVDLLRAPALGVARSELDRWVAQRRRDHQARLPTEAPVERAIRGLFGSVSPFGASSRLARRSPRRLVDAAYEPQPHPHPPPPPSPSQSGSPEASTALLDAVGFDWYDPMASRALRLPGHRSAGRRRWSPSRALWDVPCDPAAFGRWCRDEHQRQPDLPLWIVENGMATRVHRGRSYDRDDGWDRPAYLRAHLGAVIDALDSGIPLGAYLHWSLVDNYEWGSYAPRFGIFGVDRDRGERGIRWLDTDAQGRDAAGAFRRLVQGLREGDRSVLDGP